MIGQQLHLSAQRTKWSFWLSLCLCCSNIIVHVVPGTRLQLTKSLTSIYRPLVCCHCCSWMGSTRLGWTSRLECTVVLLTYCFFIKFSCYWSLFQFSISLVRFGWQKRLARFWGKDCLGWNKPFHNVNHVLGRITTSMCVFQSCCVIAQLHWWSWSNRYSRYNHWLARQQSDD